MLHSPIPISAAVSGANAHLSMCELVAMMVLALFLAAMILECGPASLEHGLVCGLAHVGARPSPVRCDASFAVCCSCWYGDGFWNPRRWGSCLRGCYGGQGLHFGHPHGVRVECCNGVGLCGSHPHEQWRRFSGHLSLFEL